MTEDLLLDIDTSNVPSKVQLSRRQCCCRQGNMDGTSVEHKDVAIVTDPFGAASSSSSRTISISPPCSANTGQTLFCTAQPPILTAASSSHQFILAARSHPTSPAAIHSSGDVNMTSISSSSRINSYLHPLRWDATIKYDDQARLQTVHPCTGNTHPYTGPCDGEIWVRTKSLGSGGFGRVFREECISGPPFIVGTARAVKTFSREDPADEPVEKPATTSNKGQCEWEPADVPCWDLNAGPVREEMRREDVIHELAMQLFISDHLSTEHFPELHCWYEDTNGKIRFAMCYGACPLKISGHRPEPHTTTAGLRRNNHRIPEPRSTTAGPQRQHATTAGVTQFGKQGKGQVSQATLYIERNPLPSS